MSKFAPPLRVPERDGVEATRRIVSAAAGTRVLMLTVASLLAKLDLRDRVQAVVFAYENGVVRPGG